MQTKEVQLNNMKVTIRKVNGRMMLKNGIDINIFNTKELLTEISGEKKEIMAQRQTDDQKARSFRSIDEIIKLAVIDPQWTIEDIDELEQDDYEALFEAIIKFMVGEREQLKSFRKVEAAADAGPDSGSVPSTTPPVAGD